MPKTSLPLAKTPLTVKLFSDDFDFVQAIHKDTGFSMSSLVRAYVQERIQQMREECE